MYQCLFLDSVFLERFLVGYPPSGFYLFHHYVERHLSSKCSYKCFAASCPRDQHGARLYVNQPLALLVSLLVAASRITSSFTLCALATISTRWIHRSALSSVPPANSDICEAKSETALPRANKLNAVTSLSFHVWKERPVLAGKDLAFPEALQCG